MKKQKFYKLLQKGAVCLFTYFFTFSTNTIVLCFYFFVNNKEEFTKILLLETLSSNDTHNVWVGKTSREERRDKITLHTAKVTATLSASLRKDLASFLQGLTPITRVYLQLSLWKPPGTTEQCSATQDLHKRRQQSEKGGTWQTNIQPTYFQNVFSGNKHHWYQLQLKARKAPAPAAMTCAGLSDCTKRSQGLTQQTHRKLSATVQNCFAMHTSCSKPTLLPAPWASEGI